MWITGAGIAVLLGVVCAVVVWLMWRRLRLLRSGGIDVALRKRTDDGGHGWHLGIGRYRGDEFVWFRTLNLRSGPQWILQRAELEIAERREPHRGEVDAMPAGATILRCRGALGEVEIAMADDALTGFLSWLESAPPGHRVPWAS